VVLPVELTCNRHAEALLAQGLATPQQVLGAWTAGVDMMEYHEAVLVGASHREILAAYAVGADITDYAYARRRGASPQEILAPLRAQGRRAGLAVAS
jgi:hypothetical protein